MKVHRIKVESVIDEDAFPREEMFDGEPHNAIIRRQHIRSKQRTGVFPVMRIAWLPIHDSDTKVSDPLTHYPTEHLFRSRCQISREPINLPHAQKQNHRSSLRGASGGMNRTRLDETKGSLPREMSLSA